MKRLLAAVIVSCASCMLPGQTGGAAGPTTSSSSSGDPSMGGDPSAPPPASSAAPAAAAPAGPVSVTIRSSCPSTVKVFYGEKPGFSSGTFSSIESNSVSSHSFRPGEQLWIVDDSEHGIGSVTVGADTHELEVASGCTSIAAR
jgi:hypothetical protein